MDDWDGDDSDEFDDEPTRPRPAGEGVRILGAEEAAAALQSGQAEGRNEPLRFPRPSAPEGVRPAASFPLEVDPADVPRPTVATPAAPPTLPHWTEPPTGEVPSVLSGRGADDGDDDDLNAWSALSGGQPRWRDQHDAWDDSGYDDASVLADDEPPLGALDESRPSPFTFDDEESDDEFAVFAARGADGSSDSIPLRQPPAAPERRSRAPRVPRPRSASLPSRSIPAAAGRDVGQAIGIGVGVAVVALLAFALGPFWTALLATAVVVLAAVELYDVLRRAGYQPATLLGLSATLAIMVAAYQKGETALPLVTALVVAFTFLWYLGRVVSARPTVNAAATILAFMWTGFLGSFAVLLVRPDPLDTRAGIAFLLGAVVATAFNDIGAYVVGSRMGTRALAPEVSPNKTWEGVAGGAVVSIAVTWFVLSVFPGVYPWDGGKAFWLAVVVSIVAPLGDLAESMIKRDLGIKDMGRMLPGHGGVMDRFDALLFVLPAVYYLVRVLYT